MRLGLAAALALVASASLAQVPQCRISAETLPPLAACQGPRTRVAVVGDVLLHAPLQRMSLLYGYQHLWGRAAPFLQQADLAIANLEGPSAPGLAAPARPAPDPGPVYDGHVYSDYPRFNYHPAVIDALASLGIDAVTLANNHALDRGPTGLDRTLAELAARRMPVTGVIAGGAPRDFAARLASPSGEIVLLGCSEHVNGIADPRAQVLRCYGHRAELLSLVQRHSARPGVAGVIVLPHWGQEYQPRPEAAQRRLAAELVAAGALAVVGSHPHVAQPLEILQGPRGAVPIWYSTGNFVSGQTGLDTSSGLMAWLEICGQGAGARVAGTGYLPMVMDFANGPRLTLPLANTTGPSSGPSSGRGAQARALLARLIPGRDLGEGLICTGGAASPARSTGPSRRAPRTPTSDLR